MVALLWFLVRKGEAPKIDGCSLRGRNQRAITRITVFSFFFSLSLSGGQKNGECIESITKSSTTFTIDYVSDSDFTFDEWQFIWNETRQQQQQQHSISINESSRLSVCTFHCCPFVLCPLALSRRRSIFVLCHFNTRCHSFIQVKLEQQQ